MFSKRASASNSKNKSNVSSHSQGVGSASTSKSGVSGGSVSKNNAQHTGSPKSPDTTVIFPHIKAQDYPTLLPKYLTALGRSKDEYFPVEDLDSIQLELENLLSTVALRYRILKSEYESFDKDEKKDRSNRAKQFNDKQPTSPGKRKRGGVSDDKKSKERIPQYKLAKQKIPIPHSPVQSHHTDDSMDSASYSHYHHQKDHPKISVPKNDTPNKFWLSVEPYCMPLTNEDLKLIDDLLEQYNGPLVPPIPELGPHYSTIWAAEDLKEEQDNSNINSKSRNKQSYEVTNMLKKSEKLIGEGVTGPLTQRLVSALMEENLITADGLSNDLSNSSSENTTNSTTSTLKSLSLMKNGISIERRVKKELIEQGILDPEDYVKEQDDEILAEIKRVLAELTAISEYNSSELRRLQTAAKAELQRLEVKRKLDAVDQEIIEMYKKVSIAKHKRRTLTTEEQEEIRRLTNEQKQLSDQLDSMAVPGPNYVD